MNLNPHTGEIDFTASFVSPTEASGTMEISDGIRNPFGTIHAGALVWFADTVATTLCLQGTKPEQGMQNFPLAINLAANLLSNTHEGTLHAHAGYVKRGRKISTVRTTLETADKKMLVEVTTTHIASV